MQLAHQCFQHPIVAGWLSRAVVVVLMVLQVRLSCLLWSAEAAEVVVLAGWCVAYSLVPAPVWMHSREACSAPVRPDEKVLLHFEGRCSLLLQLLWMLLVVCSLLRQLLRMLLLVVLQVRLGSLLWSAEAAEAVVAAV